MALDLTSFDAFMKRMYSTKTIESMVFKNRPLLALVPKDENFYGSDYAFPMAYATPQSVGGVFSTAQGMAAAANSKESQCRVTRINQYGFLYLDSETIEASEKDPGAFASAKKWEIDAIIDALSNRAGGELYRSGWGEIGTIATGGVSGSTVTLTNPGDAANVEAGQLHIFSSSQNAAVLRGATQQLTVQSVNRLTGVITYTAAVSTITGGGGSVAAADYIFCYGNRQDSATPNRLCMAGVSAWVPQAAPSDTLFNIDRSKDPTRLGGLRSDARSKPIVEALYDAAALVGREGGGLTHFFMPFEKWAELEKSLDSKTLINITTDNPNVGFRAIEINAPTGSIKCIADPFCPQDLIAGLDIDTWELRSLKKFIRPFGADGMEYLRVYNADQIEVRFGYRANLICYKPGRNINIRVTPGVLS